MMIFTTFTTFTIIFESCFFPKKNFNFSNLFDFDLKWLMINFSMFLSIMVLSVSVSVYVKKNWIQINFN